MHTNHLPHIIFIILNLKFAPTYVTAMTFIKLQELKGNVHRQCTCARSFGIQKKVITWRYYYVCVPNRNFSEKDCWFPRGSKFNIEEKRNQSYVRLREIETK